MDMMLRGDNPASDVTDHGGSLARAVTLFPDAPTPWLDLSTGINPYPYPLPDLPARAFERLPEEVQLQQLAATAARVYGAPGVANVVAAPGTQILLPLAAKLVASGRAAVLCPTYAEHRRAAALAGHAVTLAQDFESLYDADLAIVVNPNNPDGRIVRRAELLDLAAHVRSKAGHLIVDEAFMDVGPQDERVDADVEAGGIVVLRSFGKFFGLAGVRLGFAIAAPPIAAKLRAVLGPWVVSGPGLEIGLRALGDSVWQNEAREHLARQAMKLDALLAESGLDVAGGTSLFRFLRTVHAASLFRSLGQDGILLRAFEDDRDALRIGLPKSGDEFGRLARSLRRWRQAGGRQS